MDRSDFEDGQKRSLLKLNKSDNTTAQSRLKESTENGTKNKKCVRISAVVGVLLLVVTIIIILTAKKGGGNDPTPGPKPPISGGYNPYKVSSFENDGKSIKGFLKADSHVAWTEKERGSYLKSISANQVGVLDPRVILEGKNNELISNVSFEMGTANQKCTFLWLDDAKSPRFSIPEEAVARPKASERQRNDLNGMSINSTGAFSFKFHDNRNKKNIFLNTEGGNFVMMDKYMQLDLTLPSRRIYGLGERNTNFTLQEGTWTMWANGQQNPFDDGSGGLQTYGVHPFALVQTANKGEFFGIFFRNANAQSPVLKYEKHDKATLSYITTGGSLEIYFFWKGNAKQIIQQYQQMFGKPTLPPIWALGWHSASRSYKTLDMVKNNVEAYKNASLPLESVWLDISYMSNFEDFTVNETSFAGLKNFTETIQDRSVQLQNGQRMIVIVDPGLTANEQSQYYNDAQQNNVLMKSSINPDQFNGALTAQTISKDDQTVFLDFWTNGAKDIWSQGLTDLYQKVPFDGLWLDMNEATIECNGECPNGSDQSFANKDFSSSNSWYQSLGDQSTNSTYDLPFIPGPKWNLDNKSLSLNATHPVQKDSAVSGLSQYDTHSLFGHMQAKATSEFLGGQDSATAGKRPFVLSRSTFAGSGQYSQHWLGENQRTWDDMKQSIAGIMNFNMFGIPLVGPDTCGFFGQNVTVTQKLCTRWIQLASFYPFARQNRDDTGGGGENGPYAMDEIYEVIVQAALFDRLSYTRHLYSCLYEASQDGGTCFDPLMFHFPLDDEVFNIKTTEHSFIFANALKITPVLDEATSEGDSVSSYFPKGTWVSMNNYTDIIVSEGGKNGWFELPVSWDLFPERSLFNKINTHLMPGAIVAKQEVFAYTTNDLNWTDGTLTQFTFVANRDENGAASMKLYLDDGISIDSEIEYYEFVLSANSLKKQIIDADEESKWGTLRSLVITNAWDLNATNFACFTTGHDGNWTHTPVFFQYRNGTLVIMKDGGDFKIQLSELKDIHWGNDEVDVNMCDLDNQYNFQNSSDLDLSGHNASMILTSNKKSLPDLQLNLTLFKSNAGEEPIVNIKWSFSDSNSSMKKPFEVPKSIVSGPQTEASDLKLSSFVSLSSDSSAQIRIRRNGQDIYSLKSIVLSQFFNYMSAIAHTMPNARVGPMGIMGLYERTSDQLYLQDGVYSLWSYGVSNPEETRTMPGKQTYGSHPFYMGKARDNEWFGVYTNLAAAQDWWIMNNAETGDVSVRTAAAGGLGDLFIILAKTPNKVSQIYQEIVGLPVLPPQWALGWNQCKWGYKNTEDLEQVLNNYTSHNLPLDAQWSDIDWLDSYKDFTYDPINFEKLPEFIERLHNESKYFIPIIDAGIAQRPNQGYEAYDDGVKKDIFVKSADGSEILTSEVWPAEAAFPDFFNPETATWWQFWLSKLQETIKFDGLWLDMNEATNFCNGVCYDSQQSSSPLLDKLPYIPTGRSLEQKSMPLDAQHFGNITELEAHSLFGTMETKATHEWFESQNKRTMIIERSAFSGLGQFGSRWLGDNESNETSMGNSVTGIMAHNILGIPLVGSDICGFNGNTTPELCARWHTVGAFYPFSRNHNHWGSKPQEPYQFTKDVYEGTITFFDIMQRAMRVKYSLVRYYYTQLSLIHKQGGSLYKPLFFEFPDDPAAYNDQQFNIMLGSALKLGINSAILDLNETSFLFPKGTWCDIFNPKNLCITNEADNSLSLLLPSKAYDFHLHLREGHIIPMQNAQALNVNTTSDLQRELVEFHIHPGVNQDGSSYTAEGDYINDDGKTTKETGGSNAYTLSYFQNISQTDSNITLNLLQYERAEDFSQAGYKVNENDVLGAIYIYNAEAQGNDHDFWIHFITKDGQDCSFYPARYDQGTDRVVFIYNSEYCFLLPNIQQIVLSIK